MGNVIEVTDKTGWSKAFTLQKTIAYVGADARNDIVLDPDRGAGVSPRHLQLISVANGFRMINMGDTEVRLGANAERLVAPRAFLEITSGDRVQVGDFILVVQSGGGAGGPAGRDADGNSKSIGLTMQLAQTRLDVDKPLQGAVVVRNWGIKAGVQFTLEVEGLDPACLEIGPGPLLFPNAEKEVVFKVHHPRAAKPPAGDYRIRIRATAPAAYPGEAAVVSQVIQLLPFYSHKLRVVTT
jgi:predicted component of type VI protein secretion system